MFLETPIAADKLDKLIRWELKKKGFADGSYSIDNVKGGINFRFNLNCIPSLLRKVEAYQLVSDVCYRVLFLKAKHKAMERMKAGLMNAVRVATLDQKIDEMNFWHHKYAGYRAAVLSTG
jgi:hypothetical protein